jgi:hypothetical protein
VKLSSIPWSLLAVQRSLVSALKALSSVPFLHIGRAHVFLGRLFSAAAEDLGLWWGTVAAFLGGECGA